MIPLSLYALIAIIVAFTAGFFLGKKKGNKKDMQKGLNQQNAGRFSDLGEAQNAGLPAQAGEKGRATIQTQIQKRKERIMDMVVRQGRITNDDVEDLFDVSDATARNYLNDLEEDGKLVQNGESGRGVYYTPVE